MAKVDELALFDDEVEFAQLLNRPVLSWDASLRITPHATRAAAAANQPDLFYLESVFVTAGYGRSPERQLPVGWNLNDDFFDPADVWAARSTPEDKPLNINHNCGDIIGHITAVFPEDLAGRAIAGDSDRPPDNYNLVTRAVIYRVWWNGRERDEKKEQLVAGIIDEIRADGWRVSMECLFSQFDYILADAQGNTQVIQRTRDTSHLTRHLRIVGGSGTYAGQRIGRALRNMTFSGKGLVKIPANEKSIIRAETPVSSRANSETTSETSETTQPVYATTTKAKSEQPKMTETEQKLQAELAAANKALEEIKQKELVELKSALTSEQAARKSLESAVAAANENAKASIEQLAAEKAELAAALAAAQTQLAELSGKQTLLERVATVVDQLKYDKAQAEEFVRPLVALSAEQFAAHVATLAKSIASAVTNNPAPGNTNFSGQKPRLPEKKTPLPVPEQKTPLPTPKPAMAKANADEPEDTEKPEVLDTVTPEPDAALATAAEIGRKTEAVRAVFHNIFGQKK